MNITAVSGCFDVVHVGHVKLLQFAASFGLRVIMGINSDRAIRILKGPTRPIYNEEDRVTIWGAFYMVSNVYIIDDVRVTDWLLKIKPAIWVKGAGYTMETLDQGEVAAARSINCEIKFAPHIPGQSTTETIKKLKA